MRIAVVGGGPGGLFAATLARAGRPDREVTVLERNRAEDTFGFGVVFSDAALEGIHAADPVVRDALTEHGVHWDPIEVRLHGERFLCHGNGMAAVERRTLLHLLQRRAVEAGVEVRFSTEVDPDALLAAGYDLVVAADGAHSRLRDRFADVFEPSAETATAKFVWLGTTYPFERLTFLHERGPHGVFAVHGYPIGTGVGTFIVETDEDSWRAAGLDGFDVTQPPGPSDERTKAYLQDLFAGQIAGHPLLVNNSRWGNFRTRRARRWRHRVGGTAVALLGDAAHTAHFSVGSGTKMAMEDAVALVTALDEHGDDVDAALATYETVRQPQVARIQDSARPSLSWWEHFGRSHDTLPAWQFAYHFFTRSLTESKLRRRDDAFVAGVHDRWRAVHGAEPLDSPLEVAGQRLAGRVVVVGDGAAHLPGGPLPLRPGPADDGSPWGLQVAAPDREDGLLAALDAVAKGVAAGTALVAAGGGTALTRRLLCEAARLEHGAVSLLVEEVDPGSARDVAVTAVVSGRTDLVSAPAEEAGR
ncbi:FAD-dependent monooxygenase [Geodermatophilus marinus]|uniref:FAD-dependent monooxygenase n=1 Tax=Geodermatophilus sp. LHW52908 TaxID=2303986 RepID=UPI000E3D2531|nr:FAD-dependent monooxygenase [Geodermatophilus sp. LHW52908]RFU21961.1 2-polyprenyl-6-methoxyphenol hydroxylase [Geodermatophilus sp. LHW52908]